MWEVSESNTETVSHFLATGGSVWTPVKLPPDRIFLECFMLYEGSLQIKPLKSSSQILIYICSPSPIISDIEQKEELADFWSKLW